LASDKQIDQLKDILEERRIIIQSNIDDSRENIAQLQDMECKDDFDFAESSSDSFTSEIIARQQCQELTEIDNALKAIEDGSYGTCVMCDELIAIGRLKAKPFAKYCTVCREIHEEEMKIKEA
jgi:DnaK suppressor protein